MNINVTALVPGDVIIRDDTDITVERVEVMHYDAARRPDEPKLVRIYGRITRGYGRSSKVHTWTHFADAEVDVDRGEARYIFNRAGREVRVR